MIICRQCGAENPDGATRCVHCYVSIGHQIRAGQDARRGQVAGVTRIVTWVAALVVLAIVAVPIYRVAGTAYFKYHLKTTTEAADKACNGPITDSTPDGQRQQIQQCLDTDEQLQKALADYANFTKGAKK